MYDCPRDSHALMQQLADTGTAWRCNMCSGAFLSGLLTREVASSRLALGPREAWDLEVVCPKDAIPMQKVTVSAVAIDYCATCASAWLDGEEVERLFATPEAQQLKAQPGAEPGWLSGTDFFTPAIYAIFAALAGGH